MKTKLLPILTLILALAPATTTWPAAPTRSEEGPDSLSIQTFPMGFLPGRLAFDGANIWVTNIFGSSVAKVRASDGVILATYPGRASSLRSGL